MISRHFDLMGPVLRVNVEDDRLADRFGALLRGLAIETANDPAFTLTIQEGTPKSIPGAATTIYEGPVFWEGDCVYAEDGGRLYLSFPGRLSLMLDPEARAAQIVAAPDSVSRVGATAGMLVVDAAVDASGQFMLHAAGLTVPGTDAQVLVFAQSGTGKTTTSLALADSGFGLCTDDSMVIRLDGTEATGWGLPRDLKVHHNTAEMMPWLKPYLKGKWNDEGEQAITRAALSDRIRVETAARRPIAGVFFLERGNAERAVAAPLSQTDTLVSLAADNVRTGRTGLLKSHQRRFAGLAGLASSAPTFKVTVGSDPRSTAPAILDALGRG
ncbi:serine kinase [Mesorhizobium sp. KR9-304]|uniref:serine kinase n=1 Tax=Mesorhizobium sp. KR9-304 TaxID=3156614 RepID=UPI0032B5A235